MLREIAHTEYLQGHDPKFGMVSPLPSALNHGLVQRQKPRSTGTINSAILVISTFSYLIPVVQGGQRTEFQFRLGFLITELKRPSLKAEQ
ncbi:hypothetical protein CC2G_007305 [Coprinopsis cinerea AmutBmut pab1-1]|nr:hypothetical protein CC2G_007305 [Coprinopsis cinerea AmutBmut pab1-1]